MSYKQLTLLMVITGVLQIAMRIPNLINSRMDGYDYSGLVLGIVHLIIAAFIYRKKEA